MQTCKPHFTRDWISKYFYIIFFEMIKKFVNLEIKILEVCTAAQLHTPFPPSQPSPATDHTLSPPSARIIFIVSFLRKEEGWLQESSACRSLIQPAWQL